MLLIYKSTLLWFILSFVFVHTSVSGKMRSNSIINIFSYVSRYYTCVIYSRDKHNIYLPLIKNKLPILYLTGFDMSNIFM